MRVFAEEADNKTSEQQLKRTRLLSLANVFSRTLSVLSGRKVKVNVVNDNNNSPAWSSTQEVWLNESVMKIDSTARSIASINGLAFHELSHIKFTPRRGTKLVQLIQDSDNAKKLWESFNCLEDSRIENLMVAYLPNVKNWLVATIADYLLDKPEFINRAFPLIYGRYYLPKDIRQLATDSYSDQENLSELKNIIDEYTSLIIDNSNTDQAFELIKRFSELLDNLPPVQDGEGGVGDEGEEGGRTITIRIPSPNGHSHRPSEGYESSSNRPMSRKEQLKHLEKALKNRDVTIEIQPYQPKEESTNQSNADDSSSTDTKENSFGESFDDSFGDSFGDSSSDEPNDSKEDSDSDDSGNGQGAGEDVSELEQQVQDTMSDLLNDSLDELVKEINQLAKQLGIKELDGGNEQTPERASYQDVPAPAEIVDYARAFGRELERLKAEYDPAWLRYRDTGKVNPIRYKRGDDLDTIFDEWSEGRDDVTDIEAVILLDKSGSMDGENANNAYQSMFLIKKALERVNARTSVCLFDYSTTLLYGADEKTSTTIRDGGAGGGTNPESALLYAKRILAETQKPIRILFMITDGMWDTTLGEQAVADMKKAGVLTCQALIQDITSLNDSSAKNYVEQYRHSFELMVSIKSAKEITKLGKELVRLAIKRNLVANA